MTYKEALHIGSKADGTIKGAFAEFFDESGKKCFSLQRRNFTQTETVKKDETLIVPVAPRTYEFITPTPSTPPISLSGVGDATDLVIDLDAAVCRTYAPAKTGDKIPVVVTNDARQYIEEKILKKSKYYRIYATYTVYKNGDWLNPERRTELIWNETYKPSDAQRKAMYDGTPYRFAASMPGTNTRQISAWLNGNLIGAPDGINTELFRKSLWAIGVWTWANAQNIPNAQTRQWLLQFGYPTYYFLDAWAWKTKYEASQEEALEMLIADRRTQFYLERMVDIVGGGEVYVDIQLEERYGVEDYSPEQKAIAEMLNKNATFYVNPAAFDWQNTDIKNATVEVNNIEINLDAYIAECKKKYDQAKAILAAAGVTSLL